jgi:hypothetical protein
MKIKVMILILLSVLQVALWSCEKDNGSKINSNPYDNGNSENQPVKLNYTTNADSVILKWELLNKTDNFDYYEINCKKNNQVSKVDPTKNYCLLTHIPYNEVVPISFSMVKGDEIIYETLVNVKISGLDTVFAHILIPDRGSVTGGDGTYSIALPDGRSIFLMGDSFIGPVTNGSRSTQDHMYRNTYILYDRGRVQAIYGANGEKSSAAVPPGVTDESKKWYWPGHGFVYGNKLYIFQTLMYQGEAGMWGFRYQTTDILEYELPGINLIKTTNIPYNGSDKIHYGMAALKDDVDDYIYIYAQADVDNSSTPLSDAYVARTKIEKLYTEWEYYCGSNWDTNYSNAVKMSGLSSVAVSSQFNVFKLRGKYVLLTQQKQFGCGDIYTFIANSPEGPWYNKQLIYTTQEQQQANLFTYNAMAHPQFEKDGMILISYNVNTEDFAQQLKDVSTYRPRFLWIEINKILGI